MRRVVLLAALVSALATAPAVAACHIAAFDEGEASGREGRTVTLTVRLLGGQPSCGGAVTYSTEDGSARAGADYEAASGRLEFEANDDRTEEITIRLLDDTEAEGDEEFTVVLGPVAGSGIQPEATPATITIRDDDQADPSPSPTSDDSPSPDDSPSDGSPSPTATPTLDVVGASNDGVYIAIALVFAVLLILFALRARRAT